MKILVTGGAGFIGSQVAAAFCGGGHAVTVLDNLSSGKEANIPAQAEFVEADIASPQAAELVADGGFQVIDHHAAQVSVPYSVKDPLFDLHSNLTGLLNLLEAGRKASLERFIFISSGGAVYGELEGAPVDESYPARPLSPYAVSKRSGELYLDYYAAQHGLGTVMLRYANVYGPRQVPHAEAGVVAIFMDCLVKGEQPTIYRPDDLPGGMLRDYAFVGDVVRANLLALEQGSGVYNIGTGVATDTLGLWQAVQRAAGKELGHQFGPVRQGDIRYSALDCAHAKQGLGWAPQYDLDAGLAETWAWRTGQ
ncbi:MAG: NAD-dependent epimerase/dehydratase family protein [Desulfarculaceae bacterium]|nr:NAD-dependent epimerase/dehydratase family protein [Desulfarculaceae bacterium]MCF8073788.1 NAD-dependent epimerase/dehydratase family protein [Desulfarculaceae bacterium]MCF8102029.1 NAD-dependent epimerase/dehydratase family protein [Desulfarculaceae bacterium]MCF8115999.1 NAD-dependent epimerase/dehydratase family protein [Desulfarculaceae bacterium]